MSVTYISSMIHLYPCDVHFNWYYFDSFVCYLHPFLSLAWLFPNAPCGICVSRRVSTFPGISLGTDNRSQKEDILEFRGAAAATHAVLALVVAATWDAWNDCGSSPSFLSGCALLSRGDFPREPHVTARDRFPEQPDRTAESSRCNYRLAFFPMLSRTLDISQLTVAVFRLWRFLALFETSGKKTFDNELHDIISLKNFIII